MHPQKALACGTPVITYNTGGSPEIIDKSTGVTLQKGDLAGLRSAIDRLAETDRKTLRKLCADRAKKLYNKNERFEDYIFLYRKINEAQK